MAKKLNRVAPYNSFRMKTILKISKKLQMEQCLFLNSGLELRDRVGYSPMHPLSSKLALLQALSINAVLGEKLA